MKDLDFDEIDQAVNSVNTGTPENENVENIPKNDTEFVQTEDVEPTTLPEPAEPAEPLAGRRSSGQFMDVVHPSSNMRIPPLVMPGRDVAPPPPTNDDPMESRGQNQDTDITNDFSGKPIESPDSPFLPDAQVEKRPLDAFLTEPNDEEKSAEDTGSDKTETDNVKPAENNEALPAELQDNLLKIESDNSINPEVEASTVAEAPTLPPSAPASVGQPTEPNSVTQQYKDQPTISEQNSDAANDTNSYHKDLIKPIKKKAGWMWVVWIIILVVAGASAGYVIYRLIPIL